MRVLFWGTPDFALPTLRALLGSSHRVVGAVTRPDRPAGRGRSVRPSPVKEAARERGIPVLQPEKPRGEEFLGEMEALDPEVSVVAAYGEILPEPVLELPPAGSLNVHASLLPELRGAAPINWAVVRGHERSGVTVMRMVRELDAGPILLQREVEIPPRATAGQLFERLAPLGAEALLEALRLLEGGRAEEREQDHEAATYAPKLGTEEARVDWTLPAVEVDRWLRGLDPWPASWSTLEGRRVQLFAPRSVRAGAETEEAPGTVLAADPGSGVRVATGRGVLELGEVKPAGSSRMSAAAWVRGRGAEEGQRFE